MKRIWHDYISDISKCFHQVHAFTKGMSFEEFIHDEKTVNAVIRSLEVMGEATKKIPDEIRTKYKNVPWKQMAGMRDKLIHEYSNVDLETVWTVVKSELPPIAPTIEIILEEADK